jgi:hypothetical protein
MNHKQKGKHGRGRRKNGMEKKWIGGCCKKGAATDGLMTMGQMTFGKMPKDRLVDLGRV